MEVTVFGLIVLLMVAVVIIGKGIVIVPQQMAFVVERLGRYNGTLAAATELAGGMQAVNLKIAEQYVTAFGQLAKTSNTLVIPANVADVSGMIASAMSVMKTVQGKA